MHKYTYTYATRFVTTPLTPHTDTTTQHIYIYTCIHIYIFHKIINSARCHDHTKCIHIHTHTQIFDNIIDAARCYDRAARAFKGDDAITNFPPNEEETEEVLDLLRQAIENEAEDDSEFSEAELDELDTT